MNIEKAINEIKNTLTVKEMLNKYICTNINRDEIQISDGYGFLSEPISSTTAVRRYGKMHVRDIYADVYSEKHLPIIICCVYEEIKQEE